MSALLAGLLAPSLRRQEEYSMGQKVDEKALDSLFREARSYTKWQPRPVTDQTLRDLYELLKWGPTSANSSPARFAFLRSKEAKERLRPALAPLNVEKTIKLNPSGGLKHHLITSLFSVI